MVPIFFPPTDFTPLKEIHKIFQVCTEEFWLCCLMQTGLSTTL